ncbi:unnamed protein product [Linum tenue]|uniref:F-box domain-containing protein n=1 Tax=Linum tenue TaxID=586396 RepID=A0AAV0P6R2_9ROSI|nr:unnamed protein product [Linum tenue]
MATEDDSRRKTLAISPPAGISKLGDHDLLAEVLCRLPDTKSAWRCKSVCKRWYSLISTPYFSRRFLSHPRFEPPLLIPSAVRGPIWSFLPLPSDETPFQAFVADCFRDLLLVQFADRSGGRNPDGELRRTFLVCNPFTKQWVALPLAPKTSSTAITARLVCKPCDSINTLFSGGGEEPFTHHSDYRFLVVRLHRYGRELDVFCSGAGVWTELALFASIPRWDLDYGVVSLNGKLYWKDYDRKSVVVGWNPYSRLDDDNDDEAPILMDSFDQVEVCSAICSSQAALHLISPLYWTGTEDSLSVWRWEEEEEGGGGGGGRRWKRHYQVSLNKLFGNIPEIKSSDWVNGKVVGQHLEKPEVIFVQYSIRHYKPFRYTATLYSCDLRREETELFADQTNIGYRIFAFQPKVNFWPTPISNYEKLRVAYDGRYSSLISTE